MSFRLLSAGWIISSWMHAGDGAGPSRVLDAKGLVVEKSLAPW